MRKIKILIIMLLILLICTTQLSFAFASSDEKIDLDTVEDNQQLETTTNIGMLLLRYLLSVIGILILTYLGVKFFARSQAYPRPMYGDWIQVIDQMPLGTNKGIYLLEIEGKGYVMGITDQQINVITTIEEEKRLDELRELSVPQGTGKMPGFSFLKFRKKKNFQSTLQQYLRQTQELYDNQKKGDRNHEE
ncbi:MAG: FliO/MopB family protein [Peptococcaceae bacterium]